jgi:hypothetical protein
MSGARAKLKCFNGIMAVGGAAYGGLISRIATRFGRSG